MESGRGGAGRGGAGRRGVGRRGAVDCKVKSQVTGVTHALSAVVCIPVRLRAWRGGAAPAAARRVLSEDLVMILGDEALCTVKNVK